jgi:hypothetical protein
MCKCANVQMCKWENGKMGKCANGKMEGRELITISQTIHIHMTGFQFPGPFSEKG